MVLDIVHIACLGSVEINSLTLKIHTLSITEQLAAASAPDSSDCCEKDS